MKDRESRSGPFAFDSAKPSVGVPLFHAAWLFAVGIVISHYVWLRPAWLLLSLAPLAVLCGLAALRAQRMIWLPLGALWCALGVWCAEMQPQPSPDAALATLSDGLLRTIEGTVTDAAPVREEQTEAAFGPPEQGPAQRVDLQLSTIETVSDLEDVQVPATGRVRITVRWLARISHRH